MAAVAVGASVIVLAMNPVRAGAAQFHAISFSFGTTGAGAGQLNLTSADTATPQTIGGSGLAVDSATHDVYVADTGNHRVAEFTSSGTFVRAWGFGVSTGASEAQVCTLTCQQGIPGSSPGQFEDPTFIAVDNSAGPSQGDVYVADTGNSVVQKFTAEGQLVKAWGANGQLASAPGATGTGSTTTGSSDVTEVNTATGSFAEAEEVIGEGIPAHTFIVGQVTGNTLHLSQTATATASGVALTAQFPFRSLSGLTTSTNGSLLVFNGTGNVLEFDQSGSFATTIKPNGGASPDGIAVDAAEHIFLADGFRRINEYAGDGVKVGRVTESTPPPTGLAVDTLHGDLYVDAEGGTAIQDFYPDCAPTEGTLCTAAQLFTASDLKAGAGLAVDPTTGTIYVASTDVDQIDAFEASLEAATGLSTEVAATSATVHGEVNPKGSLLSKCGFEYGPTANYGNAAPCAESVAAIGAGESPVAVHADLASLSGGTTYHYRLHVTSAKGDVRAQDEVLTTLPTPVISSVAASSLSAESAELTAEINPRELLTQYRFEYGTTSAYGTNLPVPDGSVGAGSANVAVAQILTGLTADTTYHFRVVAHNANGTTTSADHTFIFLTSGGPTGPCANEAFRTGPDASLPDCRAYEQVTPSNKNGATIGDVFNAEGVGFAEDGSQLIAPSIQCFEGAQSCTANRIVQGDPFSFTRSPTSWVTTPMAPPASDFTGNTRWGFDADTGVGLFSMPSTADGLEHFYDRQPSGVFLDIGPATPSLTLGPAPIEERRAATADLSHLLYEVDQRGRWPFDATIGASATPYEYVGTGNTQPLLVGVSGGEGSTSLISRCGTHFGGAAARPSSNYYNPLSADGRTVFFSALACSSGSGANEGVAVPANALYARIDGEAADAHTLLISGRSPASCTTPACQSSTPRGAQFEGASRNGKAVVFASTQQLTNGASQDSRAADDASIAGCTQTTGSGGCNLYLYDFTRPPADNLIDLSAGDISGVAPQVQGVIAISPDGSHVYFVAKGTLTESPNSFGQSAQENANNLFVYEQDAAHPAGHLAFVAVLSGVAPGTPGADANQWELGVGRANVTPDGRFLLLTSQAGLTPDAPSEGPAQVYRYDSQTTAMTRVSSGERGFNDNGNAGAGSASIASLGGSPSLGPKRPSPSISDDGSYVFFQSPVGLTPAALNNDQVLPAEGGASPVYAQNIYEYHEDHIHLISDGEDRSQFNGRSSVQLIGADARGANVFFSTASQLVHSDRDSQIDYYDARVEGGVAQAEPVPLCEGDACKGAGSSEPLLSALGTTGFNGVGNLGATSPPPPPGKIIVSSRATKGAKAILKLKLPSGGVLTCSGTGLKTVRRVIAKGSTVEIVLTMTQKARAALRKRGHLKSKVRLSLMPTGARSSLTTPITLNFRAVASRRRGGR